MPDSPFSTGTAQDLLAPVVRAGRDSAAASGKNLPGKHPVARFFLEPLLIILGEVVWGLLELTPALWVSKIHEAVFSFLAKPHACPFVPEPKALKSITEAEERLSRETGTKPALLALLSHAPVHTEAAFLNFELVRHFFVAARLLRGSPCRQRLVLAVDPFALDTASLMQEGLYAGFMGNYHIGLDREILGRGGISRFLLQRTSWTTVSWRLIKKLKEGATIGMVLSGGVEGTARVVYTAREWLARARQNSPLRGDPSAVRGRLRENPDFVSFEAGLEGNLKKSVWRSMECWLIAVLAHFSQDSSQAETGRLTDSGRKALRFCLESLSLRPEKIKSLEEEFEEEFARQTPYRSRFFNLIARRVVAKGRPIVLAPIAHEGGPGAASIHFNGAWGLRDFSKGRTKTLLPGGGRHYWECGVSELSHSFGRSNFR